MSENRAIAFVIATLAIASFTFAQQGRTSDSHIPKARCAYTPTTPDCSPQNTDSPQGAPQFPRRAPAPPAYPPPPQYRLHAAPGPILKGALIGCLIGFGFGAAPGGNRSIQTRLGLGAWIGFIGAGLGAAIAADHARYRYHYHYRHTPWPYEDEDEDDASRRPTHPHSAAQAYVRHSPRRSASPEISQNSAPGGTGSPHSASDR